MAIKKNPKLYPEHLSDLRTSGINEEIAIRAGLYSCSAKELSKKLGWKIPASITGLIFPYGEGLFRAKLYPPLSGKNGRMKYAQPKGTGAKLYLPPRTKAVLQDLRESLLITEGEKKALKADQEGMFCIGVGGLWNWIQNGEPIPDLDGIAWAERRVTIVPDSDVWARPGLVQAIYALGTELENRGGIISVCIIPQEKNVKMGLDDYLVAYGQHAFYQLSRVKLKDKCFNKSREWHKGWIKRKKSKRAEPNKEKKSQADILIELVQQPNITLFHDQTNTPFALIEENGTRSVWPTANRNFSRYLAMRFHEETGKAPTSDAIRQALNVIEGKACFDGNRIRLHNRVAWHQDALYYDLTNEAGQAVRVTADGWQVVDNPPLLFRRYEHQETQSNPVRGGDLRLLIPYLNLGRIQQAPLELAYVVSCFIPGIPHPIHVSHGPQGAAKSTTERIKRRLIDPSVNDIQTLTSKIEQTVQNLTQNWFCTLDNVSYFNEETSDLLCRAATGSTYSKRALYTNDETVIYELGCCVSLNGINVVVTKADLMDRAILIECARIPETERREVKEILKEFEGVRPQILGGIFDTLSKAMRIKRTIKQKKLPRMADFTLWGMAISEAMGYGTQTFLKLYTQNISEQHEEIINSNPVGLVLMNLMEGKAMWMGNMSDLLSALNDRCEKLGIDKRSTGWPKAPHILSRRLKELETTLAGAGFKILSKKSSEERTVTIKRCDASNPLGDATAKTKRHGLTCRNNTIKYGRDATDSNIISVEMLEREERVVDEKMGECDPYSSKKASQASQGLPVEDFLEIDI